MLDTTIHLSTQNFLLAQVLSAQDLSAQVLSALVPTLLLVGSQISASRKTFCLLAPQSVV